MTHSPALTRRQAAKLSLAALFAPAAAFAQPKLSMAEALDLAYRSGALTALHGIEVRQGDRTLLQSYFEGHDQRWGQPLGLRRFDASQLHDLRSVSKSITSLVYGIALDRGLVPPPEAPLLSAFPDHADLAEDATRAQWTVGHALNMTLGTAWNEALPYTDPNNSEIQMETAPDRIRFILDRPIAAEPGLRWSYNGGCTALIGEIIARGTGQPLDAFARAALFAPLGITKSDWVQGRDGRASAASGLRLTLPDLTTIGQMILQNGEWNGVQVVSESWLRRCRSSQTSTAFGTGYSNFWYLSQQFAATSSTPVPLLHASGNGGQRLYVLPKQNVSIGIFAGAYNRRDDWMTPTVILQRLILPHLV